VTSRMREHPHGQQSQTGWSLGFCGCLAGAGTARIERRCKALETRRPDLRGQSGLVATLATGADLGVQVRPQWHLRRCKCGRRRRGRMRCRGCAADYRSNFRSRVSPHRACRSSGQACSPSQSSPGRLRGVRAGRTWQWPESPTTNKPDARLTTSRPRSAATQARAWFVEIFIRHTGRDDAEVSAGRGGKHLHPL